jgi:hypothetical protein
MSPCAAACRARAGRGVADALYCCEISGKWREVLLGPVYIVRTQTQMEAVVRYLGIALLLFSSSLSQAYAQTAPWGLDVTGNIANVTDASTHTYHFTSADLLALSTRTIKTSTNWTPVSVWRGPTLESILQKVGARGKVLHVYALDDYKHDVPLSDAKQYGVIVAYERDGKPLEQKGFGPLMLIYPRDDHQDDLNRASIEARFVWQIYKIVVE